MALHVCVLDLNSNLSSVPGFLLLFVLKYTASLREKSIKNDLFSVCSCSFFCLNTNERTKEKIKTNPNAPRVLSGLRAL